MRDGMTGGMRGSMSCGMKGGMRGGKYYAPCIMQHEKGYKGNYEGEEIMKKIRGINCIKPY